MVRRLNVKPGAGEAAGIIAGHDRYPDRAPRRPVSRIAIIVGTAATRAGFPLVELPPVGPVAASSWRPRNGESHLRQPRLYRRGARGPRTPAPLPVASWLRTDRGSRPRPRCGTGPGGLPLGYRPGLVVDDFFFPMYVIEPRPGTTVCRSGMPAAPSSSSATACSTSPSAPTKRTSAGSRSTPTTRRLVSAMPVAPHYAEAFDQPIDRSSPILGIPRTDVLLGHLRPASAARRVRAATAARGPHGSSSTRRRSGARTARGAATRLPRLAACGGAGDECRAPAPPSIRAQACHPGRLDGFAIDASDHPDINELMLVSDLLVTNYSSAIFEYSLLDRPMILLRARLRSLRAERGFYFDYSSWGVPGPGLRDDG